MFKTLGSLAKAAVSTVTLPIDLAADVLTLGGACTDRREPHTVSKIKKIYEHLEDATD